MKIPFTGGSSAPSMQQEPETHKFQLGEFSYTVSQTDDKLMFHLETDQSASHSDKHKALKTQQALLDDLIKTMNEGKGTTKDRLQDKLVYDLNVGFKGNTCHIERSRFKISEILEQAAKLNTAIEAASGAESYVQTRAEEAGKARETDQYKFIRKEAAAIADKLQPAIQASLEQGVELSRNHLTAILTDVLQDLKASRSSFVGLGMRGGSEQKGFVGR